MELGEGCSKVLRATNQVEPRPVHPGALLAQPPISGGYRVHDDLLYLRQSEMPVRVQIQNVGRIWFETDESRPRG